MNGKDFISKFGKAQPGLCCIYAIYCHANEVVYIGQTKNWPSRKSNHKFILNKGTSKNPYLQRSWNKYKPRAFSFLLVEECVKEKLNEREGFYIGLLDRKSCFNICPVGEFPGTDEYRKSVSKRNIGYKHTDEAKKKISEAARLSQTGRKMHPDTKIKLIKANTGRKQSEEEKLKRSLSNKGRILSEETKNKISMAKKGKNDRIGYRHSEETKKKISEGHRKKEKR